MKPNRLVKAYKDLTSWFGYPRYSRRCLDRLSAELAAHPDEAGEFIACSEGKHDQILKMFIVFIFCHTIKNIAGCVFLLAKVDYLNAAKNLNYATYNGTKLTNYFCMTTNCTMLSSDDFLKIPLLHTCYPQVSWAFLPLIDFGTRGLFLHFTWGVALGILLYIVLTIWLVNPRGNFSVMFCVAPKLTTSLFRATIKKMPFQWAALGNQRQLTHMLEGQYDFSSNVVAGCNRLSWHSTSAHDSSSSIFNQIRATNDPANEQALMDRAEEILPFCCTRWWYTKRQHMIGLTFSIVVTSILMTTLGIFIFIYNMMSETKYSQMESIDELVARSGCRIWLTEEPSRAVNRRTLRFVPNVFNSIEISVTYTLFFAVVVSLVMSFYVTIIDLMVWLGEIRFKILYLIELGHLRSCYGLVVWRGVERRMREGSVQPQSIGIALEKPLAMAAKAKPGINLSMLDLQEEFQLTVRRFGPFFRFSRLRRDKLDTHMDGMKRVQRYLMDRIARDDPSGSSYAELMSKLFTSTCLLVQTVPVASRDIDSVSLAANIWNYASAVIGVVMMRMSYDILQPLLLMMGTLNLSFAYLWISADFHAKSRRMHQQIWTIISLLTDSRDTRLEDLRMLWLKQIMALDEHGGLAMTFHGLRVTYVNFIQLIAWSATLFALAAR